MTPENRNMITVSIRADNVYRSALRALADERGVMIGDLVREAMDAQLGKALLPYVSFFASKFNSNDKNVTTVKSKRNKKS